MSILETSRPGVLGLTSGVSPEQPAFSGLADAWNFIINRLGRLSLRPGYRVSHHVTPDQGGVFSHVAEGAGLPGSARPILSIACQLQEEVPVAVAVYIDGTEKFLAAVNNVGDLHSAKVDCEANPAVAIAVGHNFYLKEYYNGEDYKVVQLPIGQIIPTAPSVVEVADGTFRAWTTYYFGVALNNSYVGDEGALRYFISHTPVGDNVKLTLQGIPLSSDTDLARRIYCSTTHVHGQPVANSQWFYIGDMTPGETATTFASAPTGAESQPYYETAPPTPDPYGCVASWLNRVWITDGEALYWSIDSNAFMFDTVDNVIHIGQLRGILVAHDSLYLTTGTGIFRIPRPGGAVNSASLIPVRISDDILDLQELGTFQPYGTGIVYLRGQRVYQFGEQAGLAPLGTEGDLFPEATARLCLRSFGLSVPHRGQFWLFTWAGRHDGITLETCPKQKFACRDIFVYDAARNTWMKWVMAGVYPMSAAVQCRTAAPPCVLLGGAFGSVVTIGEEASDYIESMGFCGDGIETVVSGSATSGTTEYLYKETGDFLDIHLGCAIVVVHTSAADYAIRPWQYTEITSVGRIDSGKYIFFGRPLTQEVAAGDTFYIGAIPWLVKFHAMAQGAVRVDRAVVKHYATLANCGVFIGHSSQVPTTWCWKSVVGAVDAFYSQIDDTREVADRNITIGFSAVAPQLQFCGVATAKKCEIGGVKAEFSELTYI